MEASNSPRRVRLEGVPAELFLESQNHQHDLIRELTLIDIGSRYGGVGTRLPHRIVDLISDIHREYAEVRTVTRRQAMDAVTRGEETATLVVPVKPGMAESLQRWLELVEEADQLSEEGQFLTLAASPEVRALRRWYVDAILRGLADHRHAEPRIRYEPPLP
jgi:hypothetical protein